MVQLIPELHGHRVTCDIRQDWNMCRLRVTALLKLEPPRSELTEHITHMPATAEAVAATLSYHYALAVLRLVHRRSTAG